MKLAWERSCARSLTCTLSFSNSSTFRTRLCLCFISSLEPKPSSQQQLAAENFGHSSVNRRVGRACVCKSSAFACSSLVSDLSLSQCLGAVLRGSVFFFDEERTFYTHTSDSLSLCVYSILRFALRFVCRCGCVHERACYNLHCLLFFSALLSLWPMPMLGYIFVSFSL